VISQACLLVGSFVRSVVGIQKSSMMGVPENMFWGVKSY